LKVNVYLQQGKRAVGFPFEFHWMSFLSSVMFLRLRLSKTQPKSGDFLPGAVRPQRMELARSR
jgi:hypothetical protein